MNLTILERACEATAADGWGTSHGLLLQDGKLVATNVDRLDRMWGQAFYGLYVSGLPESQKIAAISHFCKATISMLRRTQNTWLRDISAVDDWKADVEEWEASKDQLLGLSVGIFFMYESTNHEVLRQSLRDVAELLAVMLAHHRWTAWNSGENRPARSPNYVWVHYWGIRRVLNHMLRRRPKSWIEPALWLMGWLLPKLNVLVAARSRKIYDRDTRSQAFWWQRLPDWKIMGWQPFRFLLDKPWYGEYFRAGCFDFGLQLTFFEMLPHGHLSKSWARRIIRLLSCPEAKATNNFNFASLYIYLVRRWHLEQETQSLSHWMAVAAADDLVHGKTWGYPAVPNGLGLGFTVPGNDEKALFSHVIRPLPFETDVDPKITGTQADLMRRPETTWVNVGLTYLARLRLRGQWGEK